MGKNKREASAIIGQKLPLYAVGIEYDDFDEGGFAITAICDSVENAKKMRNETHRVFPAVEWDNIVIRPYEPNKFYEYFRR